MRASTCNRVAVLGHPRSADEHRVHGPAIDAGELDVRFEGP